MKRWPVLLILVIIVLSIFGCSDNNKKYESEIGTYLKSNYPGYNFEIALTDGDTEGVTYWATEKKHKNVSSYITYYPKNGQIKENIPVALISNEFEQYISNKIKKSFPNSKAYMVKENSIDKWNSWQKYEYSLDNYLKYLEEFDVSGKNFIVVLDTNYSNQKTNQLNDFYSDIEKNHYLSMRLLYVPTEYVTQADKYYKGSGFEWNTSFYKSHTSDEWIYVWGSEGHRYLHYSKDEQR